MTTCPADHPAVPVSDLDPIITDLASVEHFMRHVVFDDTPSIEPPWRDWHNRISWLVDRLGEHVGDLKRVASFYEEGGSPPAGAAPA